MKELKFRIFDDGKMIYPIGQDYVIRFDGVVGKFNGQTYDTVKNAKVMQYTEKKDKHGREIYDGDTINVTYNRIGLVVVRWMPSGRWSISDYQLSECEIIGNIYENPKSIKQWK